MFSLDLTGGAQYHQQSEGLSPGLTGAEEEDKSKDMVRQDMEDVCGEALKNSVSWTAHSSLWQKLLPFEGLVEQNMRASWSASGQSLVTWPESPVPSSLISLN